MRGRLPIFLLAAALAVSSPGQPAFADLLPDWVPVLPGIPRPETRSEIWLSDVAALSSSEVWAVGGYYAGTEQPLTARWKGTGWTVFPVPVISGGHHTLDAVDAVSTNDVWAVGSIEAADESASAAFVAHFDGASWSTVPTPSPAAGSLSQSLTDVDMVSAAEGWAVGHTSGPGDTEQPLLLSWRDGHWTEIAVPGLAGNARLDAVHARSSGDVWVVGHDGSSALIVHWDGLRWNQSSGPAPKPGESDGLLAVTALSATEAWAVGISCVKEEYPGAVACRPLILHLSGGSWQPVPAVVTGATHVTAVVARSATDVWLVGYGRDEYGRETNHIQHWAGEELTAVPAGGSYGVQEGLASALTAATLLPGTNHVWAVGWERDPAGNFSPQVIRHF